MECFEQVSKNLEEIIRKETAVLSNPNQISKFTEYSGGNTISFQVKHSIDKFVLDTIKRKTGYKFNAVELVKNKMTVILER